MPRTPKFYAGAVSVLGLLALATSQIAAAAVVDSFLSGPSSAAPADIALGYVNAHRDELGLDHGDLVEVLVSDEYRSGHNGVTHVYLQQRLGGVEVVNGILNVNVMPDGRILSLGNRFVGNLAGAANTLSPSLQPEEALALAAGDLDLGDVDTPTLLEVLGGPAMEVLFDGSGVSRDDIPAGLRYLPRDSGEVRLVWRVVIRPLTGADWWNVFVDAENGAVLERFNWTSHDDGKAPVGMASNRRLVPAAPVEAAAEALLGCSSCYNVFAFPAESPDHSGRTVALDPADPTASPFGWHDTDGDVDPDFTDSRGNNVEAHSDIDANDVFGPPDIRSEGGPTLHFDDPLDLGMQPSTYLAFAVTNLFYWNNIMHDVTYQYGFDEASGNFQTNNYGNGGNSGDPVQADAQDGSGTDNANFQTPVDGIDPRMQMYIWTNPFGQLVTVNSPGSIAGDYVANPSNNGGTAGGLTRDLALVIDGTPPTGDACQAVTNDLTGKTAVIVWNEGACNSSVFVANAAAAGADAAIIIDNTELPYTNFGGSAAIPSVAVGQLDGQLILDTMLTETVNAGIDDNPAGQINRDSDLDAGVIAHEYGHGISNRLTGGPGNSSCLQHPERAGEGWSDWWTLTLFADAGDTRTTTRGVGNYVSFRPIGDLGIRNFPYSTDLGVNPQTFVDIGTTNIPHGVGEIWAAMLWEVYWNLVDKYGFDPDLYGGSGGNNLAIQLVIDGMKMQPCTPTFVQARDAIEDADIANNGGANRCQIWQGFAKRGLGFSASSGGTGVGDEVEAFDLPPDIEPDCLDEIFSDGFESGNTSAWSNTVS